MTLYVSDLLTASKASTVTGTPTPTTTWQWNRSGTPIVGSTASTYTAATADVGSTLTVTEIESNMLGSTSATSAAAGPVVAYNPIALFQNSEQGAWYDPSDITTLYQDSAGTTPVTAVEQPVGKMLDRSEEHTSELQSH